MGLWPLTGSSSMNYKTNRKLGHKDQETKCQDSEIMRTNEVRSDINTWSPSRCGLRLARSMIQFNKSGWGWLKKFWTCVRAMSARRWCQYGVCLWKRRPSTPDGCRKLLITTSPLSYYVCGITSMGLKYSVCGRRNARAQLQVLIIFATCS